MGHCRRSTAHNVILSPAAPGGSAALSPAYGRADHAHYVNSRSPHPDVVPIGQTDAEYRQASIHPEDRATAAEVTARFLHGTETVPYEARIVRPDHSIRWLNGVIS